ncbi:Tn3 family transposase [Streptomyces heilongjiangensis]|uniref:Tn3 family transposase n=1 Tax=Streptomyces heilongjiangensis TaxID=945052 RepID=A0ABW1AZH1_9ACTN|nr:Tn3 family transposase [Streptomyces heilongjiangensis]MDC2951439.1 Tn3 family transposase [Streptomyces heilongjiangensis]
MLQFVSDEGYRRMIGAQLNVTEARHRLARKIFFGQRGELRQHYREGLEDQLGALGLALNAVVLFNSLYIDAAVKQLAADGFRVTDDLLARLSPLQYDHINFLGVRSAARASRPLKPPSGPRGRVCPATATTSRHAVVCCSCGTRLTLGGDRASSPMCLVRAPKRAVADAPSTVPCTVSTVASPMQV